MSNHLPEALADAVYALWQYNGHDLIDALRRVGRDHPVPAIRELAGEAHDLALRTPVVWEAFELALKDRAEAERRATG